MKLHIIDNAGNSTIMHGVHIVHVDKTLSVIEEGKNITFYMTKEPNFEIADISIKYRKPEEKNGSLSD